MLHKGFLLLLHDSCEVVCGHFVLQLELVDLVIQFASLVAHLLDYSFDISLFVNKLLIRDDEHVELLLLLVKLSLSILDLSLKLFLLLLRSFTLSSGDFSLQLLDLILRVVKKLLLPLFLLLQLVDGCLQVS